MARLAKGGQSEVFLAARSGPYGFFRPVVIKAIPDDFKGERDLEALFYQEASISSRFSHPHVVTAHDAKWVGDDHFIVMDYVAGQTVADFAQRAFASGEGVSLDEALVIMADACDGLDYVHSFEDVDCSHYSIIHCDISPQNLMITYSGITRVFDFGISQFAGETGWNTTELAGGKHSYMSPEQCNREELDHRSDIFSLGIIAHELVTGRRLFRRKEKKSVVEAVTCEPIAPPSQVASHLDAELDPIIMKALARKCDDRYQTAGAFGEAIEELLEQRAVCVDSVRASLGEKVKELFSEERAAVASMLSQAREVMSEQVAAPSPESADGRQFVSPREEELEEELSQAHSSVQDLQRRAERATEVASALTEEVTTLQRRQNWFIAGMLALSLIALAIATMAYISHEGNFLDATQQASSADPTVEMPAESAAEE